MVSVIDSVVELRYWKLKLLVSNCHTYILVMKYDKIYVTIHVPNATALYIRG
jgi:hypothetical protein